MSLIRKPALVALLCVLGGLSACTAFEPLNGPKPGLDSNGQLISNNAGSIISNNTAGLTGTFRAPAQIVSNNAGSLISNNSGSLISNNAGSYRLASLEEAAVSGARVSAFELSGQAIAGTDGTTDAHGAFGIRIPPDRPVLVRGTFNTTDGKTYQFQTLAVGAARATGSSDISTGTSLAANSLAEIAQRKAIDIRPIIQGRLASLSQVLSGGVTADKVGVFSEGQAALLDFVDGLLSQTSMQAQASVLNGYTGLLGVGNTLMLVDNTRGQALKTTTDGFTPWLGGPDGTYVDGPVASARFASIYGMTRDPADGTIYFADAGNQRIRKLAPDGRVVTIAGSTAGFVDSSGTAARFNLPTSVALGADHALYVADTGNDRIRRIELWSGNVTTVAGGGTSYQATDLATNLHLASPRGLVADAAGTLYFADTANNEIRELDSNGNGTFQGVRIAGYSMAAPVWSTVDGTGANAQFFLPMAMAYHDGALYVADTFDHAIRRIDLRASTHDVTTLAGAGPRGAGDNDGTGTAARFRGPDSIAVTDDGTVYVGDGGNLLLRQIKGQVVQTVAVSVR